MEDMEVILKNALIYKASAISIIGDLDNLQPDDELNMPV